MHFGHKSKFPRIIGRRSALGPIVEKDVFSSFSADDAEDYRRFRYLKGMGSSVCKEFSFFCTHKEWESIIDGMHVFSVRTNFGHVIDEKNDTLFTFYCNDKSVEITVYAKSYSFIDEYIKRFNLPMIKSKITWVYSDDGSSTQVPISDERAPLDEFYPFLGMSLHDYYDNFMESSKSVIILLGPPGTGKTAFCKGLLQHSEKNGRLTYDPNILRKDHVFAEFIDSDDSFFIMEDADTLIRPRTDGNDMMAKFLNVGDGVISFPDKKIIFTTNLPSISDIDPALIRPGRCFDVLHFRALDTKEANTLRTKFDLEHRDAGGTLAEILNNDSDSKNGVHHKVKSKFGFI